MFQVASRPTTHFSSMQLEHYSHSPSLTPSHLQMPRTLIRPAFNQIIPQSVTAFHPDLSGVPLEYIRRHLASQSNDMLAALSMLSIPSSLPRSRLPSSIDAPLRPSQHVPDTMWFPTHVLAVTSPRSPPSSPSTPTVASFAAQMASTSSSTVPLYPTHALVLTAYCTLLPPMPRTRPSTRDATRNLPVVPLSVPSSETFPLLHAYLHTKRPDTLLASLLPSLASSFPAASGPSTSSNRAIYVTQFTRDRIQRLAQSLMSYYFSQSGPQGAYATLMTNVKAINGLWRNVCALGIADPELWGVMDLAWEIVLTGLNCLTDRDRR